MVFLVGHCSEVLQDFPDLIKESCFCVQEGYGIGDDSYSIAFDGCRQLIWFEAESQSVSCKKWKPGESIEKYMKWPKSLSFLGYFYSLKRELVYSLFSLKLTWCKITYYCINFCSNLSWACILHR